MPIEGHCLCGAVRIGVAEHDHRTSACHCSMCRRWSGAAMWGFAAPAAAVTVTGPIARYASSSFAERAWCKTCGTHLWIRDTDREDRDYELMPGLFEAARDMPLVREVYADRAFACVPLSGEHRRITAAEYEAEMPFVPGEAV